YLKLNTYILSDSYNAGPHPQPFCKCKKYRHSTDRRYNTPNELTPSAPTQIIELSRRAPARCSSFASFARSHFGAGAARHGAALDSRCAQGSHLCGTRFARHGLSTRPDQTEADESRAKQN